MAGREAVGAPFVYDGHIRAKFGHVKGQAPDGRYITLQFEAVEAPDGRTRPISSYTNAVSSTDSHLHILPAYRPD